MFYTNIPRLFDNYLEIIQIFGIQEGGGGLFYLCGGPSVVLEIFERNWNLWIFENFEIMENYELKCPK